jgi:hypothetical protein
VFFPEGWVAPRVFSSFPDGRKLASPAVGPSTVPDDPQLLAQAKKLVAEGAGDDLLRLPHRTFPSFISAATQLDIITTPREYTDFFGTQTPNPAITRVMCPILAFFGSKGDIGGEKDLDLLKSSVQRLTHGPRRVETTMIVNGNHEYVEKKRRSLRQSPGGLRRNCWGIKRPWRPT